MPINTLSIEAKMLICVRNAILSVAMKVAVVLTVIELWRLLS